MFRMDLTESPARPPAGTYRTWRRLLREEDAWLLRQIGSVRPVLWLRPQPLGAAARHGILALRAGPGGQLRGVVRAQADALPWADDSVPAIVLQHVCEGSSWGRALLAESARVLQPEGRLYVLRFDRLSPWFWRFGGKVVQRSGSPRWLGRWLDLHSVQARGLALEYRHAIGSRGFNADAELVPKQQRAPERWPLASSLRAARIWVLRKRRRQLLLTPRRNPARAARADYGLARTCHDVSLGSDPAGVTVTVARLAAGTPAAGARRQGGRA